MKSFRGSWSSTAVPLAMAGVSALIGLVGVSLCLVAGIQKTHGPGPFFSILSVSLFFLLCAVSLVKVAFNGFIREVQVSDQGITVIKMRGVDTYSWWEINRLAATETHLNLRMKSEQEVDFGPSLENFPELVETVKEYHRKKKLES